MDSLAAAAIGSVVRVASSTYNQVREYFSNRDTIRDTLNSLAPLVDEMMRYNQLLDRPSPEIERLQALICEAEELVKSPKSWWGRLSFPYYQDRLQAMNNELSEQLSVTVQVQNATNLMNIMRNVGQALEITTDNFRQYHGVQIRGEYGAPVEPEYFMGMDDHLSELRMELLKDGVSVLVLTGLGGSGKSTLAKKICWDPQVKGKFGTNIFFVTFAQTPNVKNVVKTLYQNCGYQMPEFENDEDAINRLGVLLRLVGRNPILLVLDDVWDSSKALVEKFKVQISDHKILVTSRFAFQEFGTSLHLEPLGHDDAVSFFHHFAQLDSSSSYMPDNNLVDEIVKGCGGSPLALEVIGGSLRHQPFVTWQNMKEQLQTRSIFLENTDLLSRLQRSLDTLADKWHFSEKECFMDLGLFPEDRRIPIAALSDMWAELHSLNDNGTNAMNIVNDFTTRNLVKLIETRKVSEDEDMSYNNHFIMLHDLLRELAAHQNNQEPFELRKKLSIELYDHKRPEWWVGKNQQGTLFGRMSSLIRWLVGQKQRVAAQVLSISTDENFASDWCDMQPDEAEVLILNLLSSQYSLPHFIDKMSKLKVLIVTNYGSHRSELIKSDLLGSLPDLRRIRLEEISVPRLCVLKNLRKLSLHMCNTRQAFENSSIQISEAMPNLVEMSINYCKDLEKFPDGVCNIIPLKKLSITNCHSLFELPQDIANLKNLEVLRLSCCSDLGEMPESVVELDMLRCLDISDCVSLNELPEDIGKLQNLKKLYMKGCSRLGRVPFSVRNFEQLNHEIYVFCDEEGATLWEYVRNIPNLKIKIAEEDIDLQLCARFY